MSLKKYHCAAVLVILMSFAASASANLFSRPGGMVYDSDLNITWLQDGNYAKTSGYDADGLMDWSTAMAWADNLVYGGYSDWRLPTTGTPDASCDEFNYNCIGSELGYLFYHDLGVIAHNTATTGNALELAKFVNMQTYVYWSATEYSTSSTAMTFIFGNGYEGLGGEGTEFNAWAVRTGDVAAVPLPATTWLFGSALASLGVLGSRKSRRKAI
ncbi:MAG: DUF1566 domain-containing protein [Candidatus Methylumidiphilus sp.]